MFFKTRLTYFKFPLLAYNNGDSIGDFLVVFMLSVEVFVMSMVVHSKSNTKESIGNVVEDHYENSIFTFIHRAL